MVKQITKFISEDGTEFATEGEARAYERELTASLLKNYEQYTKVSYSGRHLIQKHSPEEYGVWEVRGEDPNCDLGGAHHQPFLGFYEGKLKDVIMIAVGLPSFFTWGGGGEIRKGTPPGVIKV